MSNQAPPYASVVEILLAQDRAMRQHAEVISQMGLVVTVAENAATRCGGASMECSISKSTRQ